MRQLDSGTVGKQLAALLAAGEAIEITRYGRPVGSLNPYPTEGPGADPVERTAPAVGWTFGRDASVNEAKAKRAGQDSLLAKINRGKKP